MTTQEILQGIHDWTNGKIVYDISVAHPDGQGNPTKYATLAAALGTNGANIPQSLRKGGMSVKFVQSSDNNYIQARLMANAFTTDVTKWQVIADEIDSESDNNIPNVGAVCKAIGKISTVVKPSSGWYGSISGYKFNITANKDYYFYNNGESEATSIRLYNANSEKVEEKDLMLAAGASAKYTFAHDAVRVDVFFSGSNNSLDIYTKISYRVGIDTLYAALKETNDNIGFISKFTKATSGWGGTYYGYQFNITTGVEYYLSNMGESKATSIRLYNANSEKVEEKDLMLAAGASAKYTFAHDAVRVDVYFEGANNILEFYTGDSVGGELQAVKASVPALTDNLGGSDKIAPNQRLLKFQSNSIFENYNTVGAGIVGFGVKKDYPNIATVKKFRFNTYSFRNSVIYGDIQGLVDDNWVNLDSIYHTKGTNNIEIVESAYSRFFVVINYDLLYPTGMIYRDLDWQIRNSAIQYVNKDIYENIQNLLGYVTLPSYELKDSTVVNITVKKDGTGDFTTIGDAIASIGNASQRNEVSSYIKQYCIRVFPGVYNEVNLFVPDYVHIYGLHPNTVIVTSVGLPETSAPVFDMYGNCKLSNMTIISAYGYCVHVDSGRGSRTCVCENLYCKKVYNATSLNPNGDDVRNNGWIGGYVNPSVIGMGMGINEYKFIFKNCTFENGWVAAHTNANNDSIPNTRIEYHNCKLVNAIIDLQTLDNSGATCHTDGKYICVIDNVITQRGRVSLRLDYYENNSAWTVEGGANKNFSAIFNNLDGVSESWDNINTTEKDYIQLANGVSCVKDQFIDCDGNICNGATLKEEIFGIALDSMSADSLDAAPVWIGKAFKVTINDGEYGIGSDGKLSASATNKIGKVKNGILYRY